MEGLSAAVKPINRAKKTAVICHINPDGDTVGSMLSLALALEKMGKKCVRVSYDGIPARYAGLAGAAKTRRELDSDVDLAVTVDCNSSEMIGPGFREIRERSREILAIDHHIIREPYEDMAFISPDAAAVGEMVYILLGELKVKIDRSMARSILTSIIVETSSFRLPSVRAETFQISSDLIRTGLDFNGLVEDVFWKKNKNAVILGGLCLSRCRFRRGGKLAWTVVRRKDFKLTGGKDRDVDVIPDEIRAIQGVEITVFFREKSRNKLRVSLRSRKDINVGTLAKEYGGGGHSDVAGCVIKNSPEEMEKFLREASKLLK